MAGIIFARFVQSSHILVSKNPVNVFACLFVQLANHNQNGVVNGASICYKEFIRFAVDYLVLNLGIAAETDFFKLI